MQFDTGSIFTNKRKVYVSIILVVGVILTFSLTLGWMNRSKEESTYLIATSSDIKPIIYFQGEGDQRYSINEMTSSDPYYNTFVDEETNAIKVNLSDEKEINYIGKLRVSFTYIGKMSSYVRIKIFEEYMDSSGIFPVPMETYYQMDKYDPAGIGKEQDAWYDHHNKDYAYYYASSIVANEIGEKNGREIAFIKGYQAPQEFLDMLTSDVELRISFLFESVQINRFQDVWKMESLPWLI